MRSSRNGGEKVNHLPHFKGKEGSLETITANMICMDHPVSRSYLYNINWSILACRDPHDLSGDIIFFCLCVENCFS